MLIENRTFRQFQKQYEEEHRKLSTRITHMIGIPMILFSLPCLYFSWKLFVALFVAGWIFQLVGHWIFERNDPAFFRGPVYLLMGVVWAFREWGSLFSGEIFRKPQE